MFCCSAPRREKHQVDPVDIELIQTTKNTLKNCLRRIQREWNGNSFNNFVKNDAFSCWIRHSGKRGFPTYLRSWISFDGSSNVIKLSDEQLISEEKPTNSLMEFVFVSSLYKIIPSDEEGEWEGRSFFYIFSTRRILFIFAEDEEITLRIHKIMDHTLKQNMSSEEYETRYNASEMASPLIRMTTKTERNMMGYEINALGILTPSGPREKSGVVELKSERGNWREVFLSLHNDCLFFYKHSRIEPHGCIFLPTSMVSDSSSGECTGFQIATTSNLFDFKTKHQISNDEWLVVLFPKSLSEELELKVREPEEVKLEDEDPTLVKVLAYRTGKDSPKKVFILPKEACVITIGRGEDNTICVHEDKTMSRNHAKVESKDGIQFVFLDLGSSRGSVMTEGPIQKRKLEHRDTIKMGETTLSFQVKSKR
eukprot:TRINITY_DN212_c0_g1_i2.p1 TRINITY_DN212_c0_g1~~TRINITY_DN212_c0_g1_i2.p1  ORF type:complete len:473 (-),score=119.33 TRINITY_DN212_c0_g1_i2:71-1342(-)